jgi:hypothetical protein
LSRIGVELVPINQACSVFVVNNKKTRHAAWRFACLGAR